MWIIKADTVKEVPESKTDCKSQRQRLKSKTEAKTQNIYDKMNVAKVDYKGRTNSQEEKTEEKSK